MAVNHWSSDFIDLSQIVCIHSLCFWLVEELYLRSAFCSIFYSKDIYMSSVLVGVLH